MCTFAGPLIDRTRTHVCIQLLMNPFYEYDTPITSEVFDARVKTLARRYL